MAVPPPPPPGGIFLPRGITQDDQVGLRKISNGAVIGGVGSLASLILSGAIEASGFTRAFQLQTGVGPWQSWVWVVAVAVVGVVLGLIQLTWTRAGLRKLPGPAPELASPIRVSGLVYPGLLLVLIGLPILLFTLGSVLSCTPSGPPPGAMTCVRTGALWPLFVGAGLVLVGGILSAIGWIYLAIGVWRLEHRYHQSLIQVGAILLLLFPLLGDILIWVGIRQILEQPILPNPPPG